jgi:cold shock CspA family protein
MLTGLVTSLGTDGFGFISPDRGGGEFWIRARHGADVPELAEGDAVAFDPYFGELGPEAVNVRRVAE